MSDDRTVCDVALEVDSVADELCVLQAALRTKDLCQRLARVHELVCAARAELTARGRIAVAAHQADAHAGVRTALRVAAMELEKLMEVA